MGMPNGTPEVVEQDLRVLLDNAPDAIARFDRELRHVYVNEATGRENNRPATEFPGKTMEDLGHPPEVCDFINTNLRAVFDSGEERTRELLFDGPLGTKWFQCRMAPERGKNGLVEYVLVISRDVTEKRLAEKALRDSETRKARIELASTLAHEINNPMTAVVFAVEALRMNANLDADARRLADLATENLERVTAISKELLTIYKGV